jgi:hypothetical protein
LPKLTIAEDAERSQNASPQVPMFAASVGADQQPPKPRAIVRLNAAAGGKKTK